MLPASTPAVTRALEVARRLATSRNAAEVQPLDILIAMLLEEDGRAATLAIEAGFCAQTFAEKYPVPVTTPTTAEISSLLESVFFLARELAFDLAGEAIITSEALLLALVQRHREVFAEFASLGLDVGILEQNLTSTRSDAPPIDPAFHLTDATERMDTARVLDAGGNRAREALRVVEDFARFVLDDAFLSSKCKELRHQFGEAMYELAPPELLWARETQHDVGTSISTPQEFRRESLRAVATANLKRLQEALRSIEEFAKVSTPALARRVEAIRYASYTLERAVLLGVTTREQLRAVRLCALLSGESCQSSLEWTIAEAVAGGVGMIQLREKKLNDRELIVRARNVRQWTRDAGVLFIVNDRVDVARLVEADGVHLGQDDLSVKDARRILGSEALIGISTHDLQQLRQAVLDGASYLGVGPIFPSQTKSFASFAGLDFVKAALVETSLPMFAIGGIGLETIDALAEAGATRAAVGHAIAAAEEPRVVASQLVMRLGRDK